jgi:hypothetical protein
LNRSGRVASVFDVNGSQQLKSLLAVHLVKGDAAMTYQPPVYNPPEFKFEKEIKVNWDVDLDYKIEIEKNVNVDFDVHIDIEDNSTVSAFDIEDLRPYNTIGTGQLLLVTESIEDTSSLIQFQLPTLGYTVIGSAEASGTYVNTYAELTINLLVPKEGGFHLVATGETAVDN